MPIFFDYSQEGLSVNSLARTQLHKRSQGESPRRSSRCLASPLRPALGYLGLVVAASFGDIRRMWPQHTTTGLEKASDAVSNPTASAAQGGSQVRLLPEAEGSFPSPAPEQITRSALPLYNNRVVSEITKGGNAMSHRVVCGPMWVASRRRFDARCVRARAIAA